MNYERAYNRAIDYLADGECPQCAYYDREKNAECICCMTLCLDTFEHRKACWKEKFETT